MVGELLEVCAGAIVRHDPRSGCRRVLLLRREEAGQTYFTFPGGGQESRESRESCLLRELREELCYHIRSLRPVCSHSGEGVSGQQVNLHLFLVEPYGDLFTLEPLRFGDQEHVGYAWMTDTEIEMCSEITEATRLCLRNLHRQGRF